MQNAKRVTSRILVSIVLVLLVAYIADISISMSNNRNEGFLPLSEREWRMIFGCGSINCS